MPPNIRIRDFARGDAEVCKRLYQEGRIAGHNAPNDTAVDIDDIWGAYMAPPGAHFWVAENDRGEVVGMIGVQQGEDNEGEIRRLRVRADHRRRGIGAALLEKALQHCRDAQHLKVVMDTFLDREPAMALFEKFKFRHLRTREFGDRTLLYFYFDLYSGVSSRKPRPPAGG